MRLATTAFAVLLNALFFVAGLIELMGGLPSSSMVEFVVHAFVVLVPTGSVIVYAAVRRTRVVWSVALLVNATLTVAMLALTVVGSAVLIGEFAFGLAIVGTLMTMNVAYLIWRTPSKS